MNKITNLYNGINFDTLPKAIFDELVTNSNDRDFTVTKNYKGESITIDGEYLRPFFMCFSGDYNFYLNLKHYDYLEYRLKNRNCFDKDYNKISIENIYPYFKYYNDGFIKGYNEFENSLKSNTSLFSITNEQIAFKIFSRVKQKGFLKEQDGGFILVSDGFNNKEFEAELCKEHGIKFIIKIYDENLFKSGFEGGEFYKAWEIILNNPTVFEHLFQKNTNNKIEVKDKEASDLSDTTANEKIILFDPNHFNIDCCNLFNHLVDNYKKKGKIKFINIYYFLKDEVDKQKYSFNFIQDDYTLFIKTNYQIEIKKYQKAEFDFVEQKRILNSHEEQFRKQKFK